MKSINDIKATIKVILKDKIGIPESILLKSNENYPLTGCPFYLSGIMMVYLLFEIEKEYSIRVGDDNLSEYMFRSINTISKIVDQTIKKAPNVCK